MIEYKAIAEDDKALKRLLRAKLAEDKPDWRAFWQGFAVGAILLAVMDYGDIWFCMGDCDASPLVLRTEAPQ